MSADNPSNPPDKARPPLSIEFVEQGISEAALSEIAEIPPDSLAVDEETSLKQGESLKDAKRKQELAEQHEIHLTRLGYVPKLLVLISAWLGIASVFLLLHGFHIGGFELSEKVLIALITSTTANVLGLFYVVAKWLYPSPINKERTIKKGKITISGDLD